MIRYLYTKRIDIDYNNIDKQRIVSLMYTADMLMIQDLKELCDGFV